MANTANHMQEVVSASIHRSKPTEMGFCCRTPPSSYLLLVLIFILQTVSVHGGDTNKRLYVVYMGEKQHHDPELVTSSHRDMLTSILGSKEEALDSMVYSYRHGFSGFSAKLTDSQAKQIASMPGVIHVSLSLEVKLHTTRTWDFLGIHYINSTPLLRKTEWGRDVIIGIVDTDTFNHMQEVVSASKHRSKRTEMGFCGSTPPSYLLLILIFILQTVSVHGGDTNKKLYVVYMGEKQHHDPELVTSSHRDMLTSILGSKEKAMDSMVYSYRHGFSGFSAMLTDSQAKQIASMPGVIHVSLSREVKLHTTRTWDFLGVHYYSTTPLLRKTEWGRDIIIGIVDTGIWPESKSFSDEGYGPIPSRWKGECKTGEAFDKSKCNLKIIGAKWYTGGIHQKYINDDYLSARDADGHGTFTASVAAGSLVENASFHGLAFGTTRGGAPRARLAIYKTILGKNQSTGNDAGVLKAIDDAIHDGVDVLSLSLSLPTASFGSLHAVAKGITVVFAGGNDGPAPQLVVNVAPWVITVAATTIDRTFPTAITLGNNQTIMGQGLYHTSTKVQMRFTPLVFGGSCSVELLQVVNITGNVVLCAALRGEDPSNFLKSAAVNVHNRGGKGIISAQYTSNVLYPSNENFPIVLIDIEMGYQVGNYLQTASSPAVKLKPTTTVVGSEVLSPKVASFSSRGPSAILPEVLKPDVAAPGVSVLGAAKESFTLGSGTSASAPHISGIVALLKSLHPDWSPAALKSALMTTASVTDAFGWLIMAEGAPKKIAGPFDFGAGHVNPIEAMRPGLVYDIDPNDYNQYIHCMLKVTPICSTSSTAYNLNLPSIAIPNLKGSVTVQRMVTNVDDVNSVYELRANPPFGIEMEVHPKTLVFNASARVLAYEVKFSSTRKVQGDYQFGSLAWYNAKHTVRIPIAIRTVVHDFYADI